MASLKTNEKATLASAKSAMVLLVPTMYLGSSLFSILFWMTVRKPGRKARKSPSNCFFKSAFGSKLALKYLVMKSSTASRVESTLYAAMASSG